MNHLKLGMLPNGRSAAPLIDGQELRGVSELTLKITGHSRPEATILMRTDKLEFEGQASVTLIKRCPFCGHEETTLPE